MRALETIGFSLVVIAFAIGTLVVLMGGPNYHGGTRHPDRPHHRRRLLHH
ncbi:hypothetical protein [Streptomyces sp. NPDC087270]